ncbi:MAG TPA: 1-acyl-sn-glycerol-3-phosphate acyltransferase, partial [Arenibacter sp.]|nr:1-acyl-sn-glycerol-3-phosphate acyltransferase [Arenibacter sp.]
LLSMAVLYWTRGKISGVSLGIGSVLLGVTLDYSLHILTQIRSDPSIKNLFSDITKPVLMSSATTALAFTCLLFLDSRALQDLGLFAAVSVMGSSIFALLLIPHLYRNKGTGDIKATFLDKFACYNFHRNKWGIGILVGLLIMSIFTYNKVIFNKDITKLNYEPAALVQARENLDALTDMSSKSIYLAVYGADREAVLQANDSVYETLGILKEKGEILNFGSVGALVNSHKKQREKIALWKKFWDGKTLDSTKSYLSESSEKLGFKVGTFDSFHTFLSKDFKELDLLDYGEPSALPLDDYISTDGQTTTLTAMVKLDDGNSENIKEIFRDHPNTFVIDRQEMNETFLGNLKNDFHKLIGYSILVVMLILFLSFRSFSLILVTIIPIFITWWITIGIMGAFDIEFNIFNIIISTFIFGLGIDYSIFVTTGLLREYRSGKKILSIQRTSILLSAITTVLGIGVLIFAKHPALYSISIVCIIGILSAVCVAFTIQPFIFLLLIGSPSKRPISLRLLVHSVLSFTYYGLGGLFLSIWSLTLMKILPIKKKIKMGWFHKTISTFMKSVLYTNPFVRKTVLNPSGEDFKKPAILIANHTSFLDILAVGMLYPKIIYLVNDWVYKSPIFGKAVQLAGFYPVSGGIEKGLDHLRKKVDQGYSLMAFPEGTRSRTNKIRRFHKGAFYLAEQFNLDIIPILIHGNSEVLPKGSFVIRNGSITVKILDRISPRDPHFGITSRERSRNIAAYFKKEFQLLRNKIEESNYFHPIILNDYRYKGDILYRTIKKDLKKYGNTYDRISKYIGPTDTLVHLSKDQGQLDFLLSLNAGDRKIITYLEHKSIRSIIRNSFITKQVAKLTLVNGIDEALKLESNVLIINLGEKEWHQVDEKIKNTVALLILLKDSTILSERTAIRSNFNAILESEKLIILKRVE